MKLLVLGRGYSASVYLRRHAAAFSAITATTRGNTPVERIDCVTDVIFDGTSPSDLLVEALEQADALLVSIPPGKGGDPVLNALGRHIARAGRMQQIIYLSTIGVYGDHNGAWVNEATAPRPQSARSSERLAAEKGWKQLALEHGKSLQILRLAGIYGPGQSALENLRAGTARRIIKPNQVFNRIHVDDIARSIDAALRKGASGVWNISDDEPAPPQDVIEFAAALLGKEPPVAEDYATAAMTPMARSFYGENKRVSNRRLRQELGVTLAYPTYREGMTALVQDLRAE